MSIDHYGRRSMHPSLRQELAAQRVEELAREARVARLSPRSPARWRRRVGRRLVAVGNRLVGDQP